MEILRKLYELPEMCEAFKQFQIQVLEEIAIERVFSKEDTTAIADAKEVIIKSFDKLDEIYGKIEDVSDNSPR